MARISAGRDARDTRYSCWPSLLRPRRRPLSPSLLLLLLLLLLLRLAAAPAAVIASCDCSAGRCARGVQP